MWIQSGLKLPVPDNFIPSSKITFKLAGSGNFAALSPSKLMSKTVSKHCIATAQERE